MEYGNNYGWRKYKNEVNELRIRELQYEVFVDIFIFLWFQFFCTNMIYRKKVMRCFHIKARIILYRRNLFNILNAKIMKYVQEDITSFSSMSSNPREKELKEKWYSTRVIE